MWHFVGETKAAPDGSLHPLNVIGSYLALDLRRAVYCTCQDRRFLDGRPVRRFLGTPRVLLEGFGLSPVTLGLLFAGVVFLVFGAGMLAPRLSARFGLYHATLVGLGSAVVGGVALLLAVLVARNSLLPFLAAASVFLFGLGIASPLSSAAALSPFGDKAGAAAALFGFSQMAGAACGASLAAVLASDPAIGLGIVLALTSLLALVLHGWKARPA